MSLKDQPISDVISSSIDGNPTRQIMVLNRRPEGERREQAIARMRESLSRYCDVEGAVVVERDMAASGLAISGWVITLISRSDPEWERVKP